MRRRVGIGLLTAIVLCSLAAVGWLGWDAVRGRPFEPEAWRADLDAKDGVRPGMARRLIRDGTLVGQARPEVVALLGEPQPPGSLGPDHLVYWLSLRGGQSDWLVVRLGPDGLVVECRIDRE